MDYKDLFNREKHAIIHGQTPRFRIIKYIILCLVFGAYYLWRGLADTMTLLLVLFVVSLCIHFFFRYKSEGWTKSYWLYKHTPNQEK